MARLVSGVIEAARDRHAAFDPQRTPPGPLYRFLGDFCQEVQGRIAEIDPTYGGIEQTIVFSLPLEDFDAGMALGPGRLVTDVVAVNPDTEPKRRTVPVRLIDREQRFAVNGPIAASWQEGENLYLRAPAEMWVAYGSVEVQVVQNITDDDLRGLMSPVALLPLPDAAARMTADALALFMARRGCTDPNVPALDVAGFERDAAKSEDAFFDAVRQRNVGRQFFTADVWP